VLDELLVCVTRQELDRARDNAAQVLSVRGYYGDQPSARRMLSALRDLYGARYPSADPALFARFAWTGIDRD
jgi:hypothetical protein